MTMRAYHSDVKLKAKFIRRVEAHRKADRLVQGIAAEGSGASFRGCAVGCTIGSYSHSAYETELGVPIILARLEDRIFESMSKAKALEWPTRFLRAIPVGADLWLVWPKFAHWMLVDEKDGVIWHARKDSERDAIRGVGALFERQCRGELVSLADWRQARSAAYAAYAVAAAAAAYAAYAVAVAAAAYAAYAVAVAADAAYAAYAAAATDAAADAAAYAADAAAAKARARRAHFSKMADKLIELLEAA